MTRASARGVAGRAALCAGVLWFMFPAAASAQVWLGSAGPHLGSMEAGGGAVWSAGFGMGSRAAEETRNTGTTTGPFELFRAASKITPAAGAQGRIGVYLSHSISVEAGVLYTRPTLSTRATGDAEEASDATVDATMTRYVVDGSLLFHLTGLSFAGGRGLPFVAGGGGYIRELHAGNELLETGSEYHGGAGIKFWFGEGLHRFGVRADVGVSSRTGGVDFETGRRTLPNAGASLIYLF